MKMQEKLFAVIAALSWAATAESAIAGPRVVASPRGDAVIRIEDDASRFSVRWRGETVVAASPLGLELDGAPAFGTLSLESREDTDRWSRLRHRRRTTATTVRRSGKTAMRQMKPCVANVS